MGQKLTLDEVGVDPEDAAQVIYDFRRAAADDPIRSVLKNLETSRIFDEANVNWSSAGKQDPNAYNRLFIQCQENYFNHRLGARGHIFLNEVYEALGFEHTAAGAILGWLKESTDPEFVVSGFVDLGIHSEANLPFINGDSKDSILTFNVDGVIFHRI